MFSSNAIQWLVYHLVNVVGDWASLLIKIHICIYDGKFFSLIEKNIIHMISKYRVDTSQIYKLNHVTQHIQFLHPFADLSESVCMLSQNSGQVDS